MKSLYELLGLPDALTVGCASVCFIVAIAPFLKAELDFGVLKIPKLPDRIARTFKVLGPLLFGLSVAAFIPFKPTSVTPPDSAANDTIAWSRIADATHLVRELKDAFQVYRELRAGIVRDASGVPRCHVYLGVMSNTRVDSRNMVLGIQPRHRDPETPSIMAFVVRDKDGYHMLADDLDGATGMPKDTKAVKQRKTWRIPNYAKEEQLKIVLFVRPDTDELMPEFNLINAEDIVDVQFEEQ